MWKIAKLSLLVILLGCGTLRAQHYIGVRGGWGGGSARFTPSRETGTEWGLYSGGISYKFYTAQKFVGAIQADLQYMGRGFMYDLQSKGDTSYHRTINSFELPLMWQPHFYFMQRHGRFFVNLGVYLSYFMDSKYYYKSKRAGIYEQGPYTMKLTRDTRWGYGLCGGAGLSFLIRRFEVAFEGRYYFGYSDVLRNGTKYQGNPTHSPLDNINVSMAFYYRLSKEGIRAEPSKGVARRMQEAEMRRAEKLSTGTAWTQRAFPPTVCRPDYGKRSRTPCNECFRTPCSGKNRKSGRRSGKKRKRSIPHPPERPDKRPANRR